MRELIVVMFKLIVGAFFFVLLLWLLAVIFPAMSLLMIIGIAIALAIMFLLRD